MRVSVFRGLLATIVFASVHVAAVGAAELPNISGQTVLLAQAQGTEPRDLEPRYHSAPVEEESWYNSTYIFGMTRSVAQSTISPAGKAPLFLLTVPLDVVLLPFAAIGGLFG
jgi:hypothetical protein